MLIWLIAAAFAADEVTLDLADWLALKGEPKPPETSPWVDAAATERTVELRREGEGWAVTSRWTVISPERSWEELELARGRFVNLVVTVDGRAAEVQDRDGAVMLETFVYGAHQVELRGHLDGDLLASGSLSLLPAAAGRIIVADKALDVVLGGAVVPWVDGWYRSGAGEVTLAERPAGIEDRPTITLAQAAVGVTIGDADVTFHARIGWRVRQGHLDALRVAVPGAPADLQVEAPAGAQVERDGAYVVVTPSEPLTGAVTVSLTWSQRLAGGDNERVAVPHLDVPDAFRVERAVVVARDTDLETIPELSGGEVVAAARLPAWAGDLWGGTPVIARTGDAAGAVTVSRFVPMEQPAIMVDVAEYTVGLSEEGRAVVQGSITLRNETASHLVLTLPPDWTLLAVQVDAQPRSASPQGDGSWRIALPRSVETVQGLLSFPVDIAAIGPSTDRWGRKVDAAIVLPTVNAPVAVRRVTLNLPRGWEPVAGEGDGVVAEFSEGKGLAYGFGAGVDEARAGAIYRDALQAWMENDFDRAQEQIDQLTSMGADNENVTRLQSNLSLIDDDSGEADESQAARRVRELALGRALEDEAAQSDAMRKADEALANGDYEVAEAELSKAKSIYGRLSKLEQKEDVSQDIVAEEVEKKVAELEGARNARMPARDERGDSFGGKSKPMADASVLSELPPPPEWNDASAADGDAMGMNGQVFTVESVSGGMSAGLMGGVAGAPAPVDDKPMDMKLAVAPTSPAPLAGPPPPVTTPRPPEPMAVVDTVEVTTGVQVTREFLERIPTGLSYQEVVRARRGGRNPNMSGGASSENQYMVDGATVTKPSSVASGGDNSGVEASKDEGVDGDYDPVMGTFSTNFDYKGIRKEHRPSDPLRVTQAVPGTTRGPERRGSAPPPPPRGGAGVFVVAEDGEAASVTVPRAKPSPEPSVAYEEPMEIDFEEISLGGELKSAPMGGLGLSGTGEGGGGVGYFAESEPPPPPPPPPSAVGTFETLEVTATSATLVVPVLGETVRYQHLLLDTDDAAPILIRAHHLGRN